MKMILLLDYSIIFQEEKPLSIEFYLKGISKDRLRLINAFFLGIDFRVSNLSDWRELLSMWFREGNDEFANKICNRCEILEKEHGAITFLSPPAFLKFFESTNILLEDNSDIDELLSERNLFIAYLLFVSQITDHERKSEKYLESFSTNLKLPALILNQQFAYGEYSNFELSDVLKTQIIKACYLFLFLENNAATIPLLNAYCNFYGVRNWQEFFQFLFPIIQAHALHPKKGGWTHLNIQKDEDFEKHCFFMESLSNEIDADADFKSIRANPLYKVSDGVYGIIYPLFVVEKIFKGSYFKLKELNEGELKGDELLLNIPNWKTFYSSNFSESTLLYNILEHIYEKRSYVRFSGDALKGLDKEGPPDYYMRNGNDIYLFENKDIYIEGALRQSFDFEKLEKTFKEKLYYSTHLKEDGSIKTKPKAVRQLTRNIKKVLLKANKCDIKYNTNKVRIYPIIILHDASFNCPGLNSFINYWFNEELKQIECENFKMTEVRNITIINIDTLILYADFLREKRLTLNHLIDKYIEHGIFKMKNKQYAQNEFSEVIGATYEPFSVFVDNYTQKGHLQVANVLANQVMKAIFK